jgi:beta-lactamase class C
VSVGVSRLENTVRRIVEAKDSPFHCPGLVVAVSRRGEPAESVAVGVDGRGDPLNEHSVFSLCSATKLATSLALLRLVDRGLVGLDDELLRLLPEAAAAKPGVTIRWLMSHASGLPLDVDEAILPYDADLDWPRMAAAARATPLQTPPGERVQYSNVAYVLLGQIVERLTDRPFKDALRSLVLARCDEEFWFAEEPSRPPAVITDVRSRFVGTPLEHGNSPAYRALGFPTTGLMTTIRGALALAKQFQGRARDRDAIRPELLAEATRDQTSGLAGGWCEGKFHGYDYMGVATWADCSWGLGPEVRGTKAPHWTPPQASPRSFGQIGSSGCLVWVDPDADVAWAIMGTRTTDSGWTIRHGPAIGVAVTR